MTIKGPVSAESTLSVVRYPGAQNVDVEVLRDEVARTVMQSMREDMGMPVTATRDEYKIGGGLFGSASVSPAALFKSKDHPEYASVFAAFTLKGAILEVTVAQYSSTSKNYQKVQQRKMFADKAAAQAEDMYYSAIAQVLGDAAKLD